MARQVWGTFSVKDHLSPRAFITEVMLYDRLVIPIPPDDEERKRWESKGWDPLKQKDLLDILGDRAYTVPWTNERQEKWRTRFV